MFAKNLNLLIHLHRSKSRVIGVRWTHQCLRFDSVFLRNEKLSFSFSKHKPKYQLISCYPIETIGYFVYPEKDLNNPRFPLRVFLFLDFPSLDQLYRINISYLQFQFSKGKNQKK